MHSKYNKIHFIAIGGSVMHNLAIALKNKGLAISGSDDEIFEPSLSNLKSQGLLPEAFGWFPERITKSLDAIVLGMHARLDNPELLKAQELGIKIFSYPEFIFEQAKNKQRVVVAGSHGKTTVTAMIMHALKYAKKDFDYLVGAKVEGFDTQVKISHAPLMILEGDEYLSSPLDKTPKFIRYNHNIGVITGIAWDHINVFATADEYVKQFDLFADNTPKAGALIYSEEDSLANIICSRERDDVTRVEYKAHPHKVEYGAFTLKTDHENLPVKVFGKHNMQNISAALHTVKRLGVTPEQFYESIRTFKGAANRLELLQKNSKTAVYKDFAHAPSKVTATTKAMKELDKNTKLVACLELHTFSSLNKQFIGQYKNALAAADEALVYYNPHTVAHKKLEPLSEEDIAKAFNRKDIKIYTDSEKLKADLLNRSWASTNLLLMSSGNFNNLNLNELAKSIVG